MNTLVKEVMTNLASFERMTPVADSASDLTTLDPPADKGTFTAYISSVGSLHFKTINELVQVNWRFPAFLWGCFWRLYVHPVITFHHFLLLVHMMQSPNLLQISSGPLQQAGSRMKEAQWGG